MTANYQFRIVSLLPSATEIVCKLGFQDALVGRSHECDYPPGLDHLPILTKPKLNPEGNSKEIHQQVSDILKSALSVYEVDEKKLRELQPTHIVTQVQCEVCAVSLNDVEKALETGYDNPPQIVPLNPMDLESVYQDILRVAKALNAEQAGQSILSKMKKSMTDISSKTMTIQDKPKVACIEWIEPLMSGGNWIPELVEKSGGVNLFGEAGKHSPFMSWEELTAADPDIIIVFPCGFSLQKVIAEVQQLISKLEWNEVRAVKNADVYLCDGHQFFNRPGPRLLESLEILTEILHPTKFSFGHNVKNYVKIDSVN